MRFTVFFTSWFVVTFLKLLFCFLIIIVSKTKAFFFCEDLVQVQKYGSSMSILLSEIVL